METKGIQIRPANAADAPLLLRFIRELAEYEKLSDAVVATEDQIRGTLFGAKPAAEAVIATLDGEPAGFALYFFTYSTFLAKPGLYLEDLFVRESFRRRGVGKALFAHLAQLAARRDCGRFEWSALDWNEPAIRFYKSMGAQGMTEWTTFRLTGKALLDAAGSAS
jgi:GNAT superfamily N-acetyltransferase